MGGRGASPGGLGGRVRAGDRGVFARHAIAPEPFHDTAGAARWLMFEGARGVGAIASPLAARLYGLDIVALDVADHPGNQTRFAVLARHLHTGYADKGTIALSTDNRAGALVQALGAFAAHRVNLSRIDGFYPSDTGEPRAAGYFGV